MSQIPFEVSGAVLKATAYTARWAALAAADTDLATFQTWDKRLSRDRRILVPVDVQAFVAPTGGSDPVVAVAGRTGDPDPFAAGAPLAAGVHLHWAMPDSLLRGSTDPVTGDLRLPVLPDRWVVVRHLYPNGSRSIHVTGWVVDAVTGTVTSLLDYTGAASSAPVDETFTPLDGFRGGSPLWTAAYAASRNRFALHDPLTDLPALAPAAPQGWDAGRAAYTVAGWWSVREEDPLASATGPIELQRVLAGLGWALGREGEDSWDEPPDPRVNALVRRMGLTSARTTTATTFVRKYGSNTVQDEDVAPTAGLPVRATERTFVGIGPTRYHALCHGSVLGVPVDGSTDGVDERPAPEQLGASAGLDLDDLAAAFAAPGLATGLGLSADQRLLAERLVAAFTAGTLSELGAQDGLADLEEREHSDGFWSLSAPPVEGSHDDVVRAEDSSPFGPTRVGRKGRGAQAASGLEEVRIEWVTGVRMFADTARKSSSRASDRLTEKVQRRERAGTPRPTQSAAAPPAGPTARTVPKAPPRRYRPAPLMVAVSGVKPHHRHHGDGLHEGGLLRCRYPGEALPAIDGVVDGRTVVPTLGSGAIPPEVTRIVREATLLDGYHHGWLAAAGATPGKDVGPVHTRLVAEMVRIHGSEAAYDGTGVGALTEIATRASDGALKETWRHAGARRSPAAVDSAAELAAYSAYAGTPPSPVAITTWRQPWVPLFLEWRVRLVGAASLEGWTLGTTDLEGEPAASPLTRTYAGRSPLHRGVGDALSNGIREWLVAEQRRDDADPTSSQLEDADEVALGELATFLDPLDLASASLDGLREQLLGIRYSGIVVRDEDTKKPVADALPVPVFGGTATIEELRLVDAFGRTLDVPVDDVVTTTQLDTGTPGELRLTPRIQNAARWLFRLVDPAHPLGSDPATALEAWVDQVHPEVAVNPVCGFLLPDHMDESLEVFDRAGDPIGELTHDSVTDAVTWEPAPGRPVPPDAGPMTALPAHAQHVGLFADGVVRADITARNGDVDPGESSALTALLRAVDSTLWSVDAFSSLGTPTVAGLVGRPIAVVRATLRIDAPDDVDEVTVTAGGGGTAAEEARRAAYAELSRHRFPVRIGELGRSDDAVLGFFVDDDYARFHVVDKVVAAVALDTGRHRGQLGLLGSNDVPDVRPLDHPYLELEDTVEVRLGETRRLTILMLPGGKAHLTSGILPRKSLALADEWVGPGLRRLVPSLRTGPVLVDPAQVRLPKVASFGPDQQFTRRTGPLTWRDDPIVAASTAAYLPPMPHEAQEGWIRVAPAPSPPAAGGAAGGTGTPSGGGAP